MDVRPQLVNVGCGVCAELRALASDAPLLLLRAHGPIRTEAAPDRRRGELLLLRDSSEPSAGLGGPQTSSGLKRVSSRRTRAQNKMRFVEILCRRDELRGRSGPAGEYHNHFY